MTTRLSDLSPSARRQAPTQTFTIPMPPSVNGLFVAFQTPTGQRRAKTKQYKAWITVAGWEIRIQRVQAVKGAVEISIQLPQKGRRGDADNRIKAAQDLLVKLGIIEDDRLVNKVSCGWAAVEQCTVTLSQSIPAIRSPEPLCSSPV